MFHITQPWSVLMVYYLWLLFLVMSNSPKSWDIYQSLFYTDHWKCLGLSPQPRYRDCRGRCHRCHRCHRCRCRGRLRLPRRPDPVRLSIFFGAAKKCAWMAKPSKCCMNGMVLVTKYPLVNCYSLRTGKIHHAINGKIHYFDWVIFKFAMFDITRG